MSADPPPAYHLFFNQSSHPVDVYGNVVNEETRGFLSQPDVPPVYSASPSPAPSPRPHSPLLTPTSSPRANKVENRTKSSSSHKLVVPRDWELRVKDGREYYADLSTRKTHWPPPSGWNVKKVPQSGRLYYEHIPTRSTHWALPPPTWEVCRRGDDGEVYFYDTKTGKSYQDLPLPKEEETTHHTAQKTHHNKVSPRSNGAKAKNTKKGKAKKLQLF